MRTLVFAMLAAVALVLHPASAAAQDASRDAGYDALLARYVSASADGINRVDYARWSASPSDRAALDAYVAALAQERPSAFSRERAFAYWVNLYNAVTLQIILERYPVRSIREIRSEGAGFDPRALIGPWRTRRMTVEGRRLSLDDIENAVLRPTFNDPRVHYAINCASLGCPNLMPRAWRAETLEADLDAAARAYVNHPRGVTIRANALHVSSIYAWFREDFGGSDAAIITHLRRYAAPELSQRLAGATRITRHGYDWALNAR